ncbi:hypothetical protein Q5741_11305 [Paenibacillus sp. JX-17]|uniref:Uncharacterized protein n=1 Tax=Paenibacillus lacisoli TaxID=3064525 RepID=A0ABT9CHC8_9BACL|nr:hypothetical protein [Paenibacillus sp. JX-17]MDO7907003.1 hypothetical protein [Paenibacillus sp. JX-17]
MDMDAYAADPFSGPASVTSHVMLCLPLPFGYKQAVIPFVSKQVNSDYNTENNHPEDVTDSEGSRFKNSKKDLGILIGTRFPLSHHKFNSNDWLQTH